MNAESQIITAVGDIYRWIDEQVGHMDRMCKACGECCDFEAFGHRLYVTTPELLHFRHTVGPAIKAMPAGVCPYRVDGRCSVYAYRFAGCRIFTCGGDSEAENRFSEEAIRKFKELCEAYAIPYRYVYVKEGFEMLTDTEIAGFGAFGE